MRRNILLVLLLGVVFFALGQGISVLLIWGGLERAGTSPLAHTPYLLLGTLVCCVSLFALGVQGDHQTDMQRARPDETPRALLLAKLRAVWIAGVLERPLVDGVELPLRLVAQPDGDPSENLPGDAELAALYDRFEGGLLILGAPGSGRTTLLLRLARALLDRAEAGPAQPIPVVLPLSSWAAGQKPLEQWLCDQLAAVYQVLPAQAAEWLVGRWITPLLDGLDELDEPHRVACAQAIAAFRAGHRGRPLVVCGQLHPGETVDTGQPHPLGCSVRAATGSGGRAQDPCRAGAWGGSAARRDGSRRGQLALGCRLQSARAESARACRAVRPSAAWGEGRHSCAARPDRRCFCRCDVRAWAGGALIAGAD